MEATSVATAPQSVARLGDCEVCGGNGAKYTCPKCEVKTCSLKCNRIHKNELACDGLRDKTKYLPMDRFTDMECESDYRLLQGIADRLDAIKKKFGASRLHSPIIPVHLLKLRTAAQQRRTLLKFLPMNFSKHRENSTRLDFKKGRILWHLQWVFVNAENLVVTDVRVPETEKIGALLSRHLVKQEDPVLQDRMQFYQSADLSGIKLLLRGEQKGRGRFYELDYGMSVKDCLAKRVIIEYPVIHVVLRDHVGGYEIIDSDDEGEARTGRQLVEHLVKKEESDESLYNSLTNLLFINDYSDEEEQ